MRKYTGKGWSGSCDNVSVPTVGPTRSPEAPLLAVRDLTVRFGGIVALDAVSFDVEAGQICGIIGPNGAGKTTLFNCLSRLYQPTGGEIRFEGRDLLKMPGYAIARAGLARTFQNLALFAGKTVLENVMIGMHCHTHAGFLGGMLRHPGVRREEAEIRERAEVLVQEFGLRPVAHSVVAGLPFGTRKRVELARALACQPKLLLLDEPACGLNHEEIDHLRGEIEAIRDRRGVSVLLVEHHMGLVMRISDKVVALNFGRKIADGSPTDVQRQPEVIRAYLGEAAA